MYNRYKGNGSVPERIPEPERKMPPATASPQRKNVPQKPGGFLSSLPKKAAELESEDLLLVLILYLMYRESGDKELLIILGAMLFL